MGDKGLLGSCELERRRYPTNGQRSWGAEDYITKENYPDMELYQLFFTYSVTDADLTFARDTLTANPDFGGFITEQHRQPFFPLFRKQAELAK